MNIISYSFNKRDMKSIFVINYVETIKKNILNFEKYPLLTLVTYQKQLPSRIQLHRLLCEEIYIFLYT